MIYFINTIFCLILHFRIKVKFHGSAQQNPHKLVFNEYRWNDSDTF